MFPLYEAYGGRHFHEYGSLSLTESSPSQTFIEPLTVDQMKEYLSIPTEFEDERGDDEITLLIMGAREQAEILQNRDLVVKQFDLSMDRWLGYRIDLRAQLISVDLVQYKDSTGTVTTLTENVDYVVDTARSPGAIVPMYGQFWPRFTPWPSSAILIRFTCGVLPGSAFWNDAGARLKRGMKLLISAWFDNHLPFEKGLTAASEYPYAVTSCLSQGAVPRVR